MTNPKANGLFRGAACALLGSLAIAGAAQGAPVTWALSNINFADGTAVTGSFIFDADTTAFSGLSMTTAGGTSVPATGSWVFNTNLSTAEQNAGVTTGFQAVDSLSSNETGAHFVSLFSTLGPLMKNAGGTITLNFLLAGTCGVADCASFNPDRPVSASGSGQFIGVASTIPEPGTFALALAGLVAVGAGVACRRRSG